MHSWSWRWPIASKNPGSPQTTCHPLRWRGPPAARGRDLPPIRGSAIPCGVSPRLVQLHPHSHISVQDIPTQRRHESGDNRKLCSMEEWETAAITSMRRSSTWSGRAMVEVRTRTLAETRPPASRHTPGCCTFQSEASTPQHSHNCARCTVVAKDVERTATPACARSGRQREPQATEEKDSKDLRVETRVGKSGTTRERQTCHGTSLRQHGPVLVRQLRPHGRG